MGVYQRGNMWWARYKGVDGRIKFESSESHRKRDAEALYNRRKADVDQGKDTKPVKMPNLTLREFAPEYLKWCERQKGFSQKVNVVKLLLKVFGNLHMKMFNMRIVEQYQTKLLGEDLKPATINRRLATLKHMFTKAAEWDTVPIDARERVRKVKLLSENNRRLRYLSEEESQELINSCASHLRPIVIMALNTGMRRSEMLSLEWERHVDLKHGFILLDDTKNGQRREIPINQTLREVLQGITRRINSLYVFTDEKGRRFLDVKRSFATACRRAGIKDFKFHDLRHTFASQLVMKGVDITTVKELLGHKTLTMTLRYAHLAPSHKVDAVKTLDKLSSKKFSIQ